VKHRTKALQELILSTPALGEQQQSPPGDEITVSDILGREVAPVEELIPGWLEKGIPTFLAGVGGVHKSRLALQWALCLNAGAQLWGVGEGLKGFRDSKPAATMVYCAAEDDANELARRAQAITRRLKLPKPKQGMFWPCKDAALVIHARECRGCATSLSVTLVCTHVAYTVTRSTDDTSAIQSDPFRYVVSPRGRARLGEGGRAVRLVTWCSWLCRGVVVWGRGWFVLWRCVAS
jgi:hypothetical protein